MRSGGRERRVEDDIEGKGQRRRSSDGVIVKIMLGAKLRYDEEALAELCRRFNLRRL